MLQAGAKVLVDEKDLWDGSLTGKPGEFPTTILIVNKKFAAEHPQTVEALLKGHVEAVKWLNDTPPPKRPPGERRPEGGAGKALPQDVIDRSLQNIVFTVDPLAGAFTKLLQDGVDAGTTKQADINGIFDLTTLNGVTGKRPPRPGSARNNPVRHTRRIRRGIPAGSFWIKASYSTAE